MNTENSNIKYLLSRKIKFSLKQAIETATNYKIRYHLPKYSNERFLLTFDDGPLTSTGDILDMLDKFHLKAIFFMVGENVLKYPETARDVFNRGHVIGSHGLFHRILRGLPLNDFITAVRKSFQIIYDTVGYRSTFFRPPYGEISLLQTLFLLKEGIDIFYWSCSTYEYGEIKFINPNITVGDLLPGSEKHIVLLHDSLPLNVIEFTIRHFINNQQK
jgi:peptidoglycan/xylan/chitin deacetylase (PgdA/CDA1 family)